MFKQSYRLYSNSVYIKPRVIYLNLVNKVYFACQTNKFTTIFPVGLLIYIL